MNNNKREKWIDYARAIAIFCMVLTHSRDLIGVDSRWLTIGNFFFMPLFFFISGMLHKDNVEISKFCHRIVFRLLFPYFITCLVVEICLNKTIISGFFNHDYVPLKVGIFDMLTGQKLWYIPCLIVIECIGALMSPAFMQFSGKRKSIMKVIIITLSAFYFYNLPAGPNLPWHIDTAIAVLWLYYLGNLFFIYRKKYFSKWLSLISVCVFMVCFVMFPNVYASDIHRHIIRYPYITMPMALLGIASVIGLCKKYNFGNIGGLLSFFGINSLLIYMFHIKIMKSLYDLLIGKLILFIPHHSLMVVFLCVTTLAVTGMVSVVVNKYIPLWAGKK